MLDCVVQVKILEVEGILAITLLQVLSGVVGHEQTEGRCKVIRCANLVVHLREGDVPPIMGKNTWIVALKFRQHGRGGQDFTMISHCVQRWTRAPTITLFPRHIFRPFPPEARMSLGSDLPNRFIWQYEVEKGEQCVP
jgi:hypothetical protein